MAICPECGTLNKDGAKFCYKCGGSMATAGAQPQYQTQPVQQPDFGAPEGFQQIPKPADDGFIPITPTNPLPGYTPIQPVYAQPITQPVQKPINKPKSNGFCNAGLAFSIIGLCTLGSTSLLGLIFSVIGFFSAKKKNQPGTGKAITGMIMSAIIVIGLGLTFATCWNDLKEEFQAGTITDPIEFINALDHANDRATSEYKEKLRSVTGQKWINTNNQEKAYLEFGNGDTYKWAPAYEEVKNTYTTGKYKLYVGSDALYQMEKKYAMYGLKSEVESIRSQKKQKTENIVLLVLEDDEKYENGKKVDNEKIKLSYYGFCYKSISGTYKLELYNVGSGKHYQFDTIEYYLANRQNNT